MKTLLCPIDFSPASRWCIKYAAQLAHDRDAKIVLVVSHPVFEKVPAGDWNQQELAFSTLEDWHDWVIHELQVRCETRKEIINNYRQLSMLSDQFDLMVLGLTKGKRGSILDYSGFDLLKVIRETLAPIVIVPENYEYRKIKRLLYAYDYHNDTNPPMQQIKWLSDWFGAEIVFISILPGDLPRKEEDKLNITADRINAQWAANKKIKFESIVYHDVSRCLEHYLSLWEENDLLVLSINHTTMLEKIWHKSVIRQLLKCGEHPYTVLHR